MSPEYGNHIHQRKQGTMSKYRKRLPQLSGGLFLTDGGLETTLIFHDGMELPYFAAFHLLRNAAGREALTRYFERYIAIARSEGRGFILESPTWRASSDWGDKLGYTHDEIAAANRESIRLMLDLRGQHETASTPMVVSGCVGPRGDGYDPGEVMSAGEAEAYHAHQISAFAEAGADMVTAITMTNASEAVGVVGAAKKAGMPVAVSFTLETDGRLPTGQALADAIAEVDAATASATAYYMINCAHPLHFADTLAAGEVWTARIRGIRANASRRSHQELNEAPDLDAGDPIELGGQYRDLLRRHPQLNVLGGCCGTDHRHVESISSACRTAA
jgi:S-methylmethionine-dependent homocysteine/selenocysteine methylase